MLRTEYIFFNKRVFLQKKKALPISVVEDERMSFLQTALERPVSLMAL
jgi:hypothetical protein